MSVIDAVIILFLLMGAVVGFKKGVIKSVVSFVGTIIVLVLSFVLKNPLSVFLYTNFPFFNVGIEVLNVLIYEAIAFFIIFAVLSVILKVIIKISGFIEKVLKFTIILSIPSKILGAIFGLLEMYLFIFVILFSLAQFNVNSSLITDSKLANWILSNTPIASNVLENSYDALKEVVELNKNYNTTQDKDALNKKGLEILIKYNVLSKENATTLIDKGKISKVNLD